MKQVMKTLVVLFSMLAVVLLGCQPKAPTGLSDTDLEAIGEVMDSGQMGPGTTDWRAYTDLFYTNDAIVLPPNRETIKGREAIISYLGESPPITDLQFDQVEVGGSGDIAYEYGKYSLTMAVEGEEPFQDNGKYIVILKRQPDGSWKVALDIFNSDLPIAVPEPVAETEAEEETESEM
jgi:ketosteroid isomerase-like protein